MNPPATRILSLVSAFLLAPLAAGAEPALKVSSVFGDHMVLQRDRPVPVWGCATPGKEVTIEFADRKKSATADADGKWMVKLDPLAASSEPQKMEIAQASEKVVLADILVGDVWLCSGQSNMHFRMTSVENAQREIAAANHPELRFFTVPQEMAQSPTMALNGSWEPVSPETAGQCSAVAYYFGRALQQKPGVPVGLLISSVGGTRIESWMRAETLASTGESAGLVKKWSGISPGEFNRIGAEYGAFQNQRDHVHPEAVREAKAQGKPVPPAPVQPKIRCHDCPSALHNGMIAPLQPFAIRGAIWYQGESNSGQPGPYQKLLPAMIGDWRRVWGNDLPFLFVQLPPHRNTHPAFRDAQQRIWQKTPHTAMVVTTDVGDPNNIHPVRKEPVGLRLALAARTLAYGEKIESSGPLYESMTAKDGKIVLRFKHVGGGLTAKDGILKGFTIAGENGKFVPAEAEIQDSTIIVSAKDVTDPKAVRYGWANVPEVNLFNREGLPASPFRTDGD